MNADSITSVELITESAPELDGPFSDLLSGALSEVDWYEVASTRLDN